ncbi:hypothetical protein [Shimia sp.]|uniref:hypothetical protein n=1 Tax=Shimia sp. TaxID=1954381 RepID=UPI003BABBF4E
MAALLCALAGCETTGSGRSSQVTRLGDYDVVYTELNDVEVGNTGPLTPLLFTYTYAGRTPINGVTESDLKREAKRLGLDMKTMRIIYGANPYKGADGTLHVCTIDAIRQRLCKAAPTLPLQARIDYAKALLDKDRACDWTSFDAAYNKSATFSFGGDDQTLNVKAAC